MVGTNTKQDSFDGEIVTMSGMKSFKEFSGPNALRWKYKQNKDATSVCVKELSNIKLDVVNCAKNLRIFYDTDVRFRDTWSLSLLVYSNMIVQ